MATAKKLPSGSWRVRVYLGEDPTTGKQIMQSVTAATKREAEYEALQLQLKYKAARESTANLPLRDAMERYVDTKERVLSVTTTTNYRSIMRNYFQGLMQTRLVDLTRHSLQAAIGEDAKTHSPKSIRNAYGFLTAVLGEYHRELFRELELRPLTLPQKVKFHPTVLTVDQIILLMSSVRGDVMEFPIIAGLWLCMRESEICGLRWCNVDLDNGVLHVCEAKVLSGTTKSTQKTTKTEESDRYLSLHPYVVDVLRREKEKSDSEYVTTLSGRSMYKRFQTILKHCGLPHMRFHDLRHSNASLMALIGVPQYLAQLRGGWSTPTTMNRVYTHQMKSSNDGDEQVNEFFSKLLGV